MKEKLDVQISEYLDCFGTISDLSDCFHNFCIVYFWFFGIVIIVIVVFVVIVALDVLVVPAVLVVLDARKVAGSIPAVGKGLCRWKTCGGCVIMRKAFNQDGKPK